MRIEANRVTPTSVSGDIVQPRPDTAPAIVPSAENATEQSVPRLPGFHGQATPEIAVPELEQVVEKMNKAVQVFSHALQFEVTKSNRIIIRVLDTNTGEVIRQIPPEELLDTFKRMEDALGVLIDRRV